MTHHGSRRWEYRMREALIRCFTSREVGTHVVLNRLTVKQVARLAQVSDEEVAQYALLLQGFARVVEASRRTQWAATS